jgi:uncharacterized membrane protein
MQHKKCQRKRLILFQTFYTDIYIDARIKPQYSLWIVFMLSSYQYLSLLFPEKYSLLERCFDSFGVSFR